MAESILCFRLPLTSTAQAKLRLWHQFWGVITGCGLSGSDVSCPHHLGLTPSTTDYPGLHYTTSFLYGPKIPTLIWTRLLLFFLFKISAITVPCCLQGGWRACKAVHWKDSWRWTASKTRPKLRLGDICSEWYNTEPERANSYAEDKAQRCVRSWTLLFYLKA